MMSNDDGDKAGHDQAESVEKVLDNEHPVRKDEKLKEDNTEEGASDEEKPESSTGSKTIVNSLPSSCKIAKPKSDETTPPSQDSSPSKE